MSIKNASKFDPRGIIAESYLIDGLTAEDARMIFLDWAMQDLRDQPKLAFEFLYEIYAETQPDHPMTKLLYDGMKSSSCKVTKHRRGRKR